MKIELPHCVESLEAIKSRSCSNDYHVCCKNNPMDLIANCHPDAGVTVMYVNKVLKVRCGRCGLPVTNFLIASKEELDGWEREQGNNYGKPGG